MSEGELVFRHRVKVKEYDKDSVTECYLVLRGGVLLLFFVFWGFKVKECIGL